MQASEQYKILLVDDRFENLISLSAVLKKAGYQSDFALSGKEALTLLLKNSYGLIILDVQMPEMSGFDLAELIKGYSKTKGIPLIFLSANAIQKDFYIIGHEIGALDYLIKPVDEKLLLLKVRNFLKLHDVTSQLEKANKMLEMKVQQGQVSYEDLYYSLSQEVYLINSEGIITTINSTEKLCCGINASDALHMHYSVLPFLKTALNDAENGDVFTHFQDVSSTKRMEFEFKKDDQSSIFGEVTITKALIEGVPHLQVSITDITEKKRSEERLISSELRLRAAQRMAKIGDWWLDFETQELLWSDEMYNIYNCDPKSFKPSIKSLIDLIHPEDRSSLKHWIEELYHGVKTMPLTFRLINTDNSIKFIIGDGVIVFNSNGKPIRGSGTAQDITRLKEAEEELNKTIEQLNSRCNELMQFSYIVSHNLRSPVASLMGLSNILIEPDITKEDHSKITSYMNQTALNIDEQIRNLNTILSVRSSLNTKKEMVSFRDILRSISGTLKKEIQDSGIVISTQISPNAENIYIIKSYIESIFFNLISNSIKYKSPDRSPQINIEICLIDNHYTIRIADNGLGIDLKRHGEHVFGLYKRFHSHAEGKGMGLFMVKTQVETLGGTILIKSEVNKGTEFIVEFENFKK